VTLTVKSYLYTVKGKSAGSWITILVFNTGDAEGGVSDATVCTLFRKNRVISLSTWILLIVIEGSTV